MICIAGININNNNEFNYFKNLINSWNKQTKYCILYISLYINDIYSKEFDLFISSSLKIPIIHKVDKPLSYFQHINNIIELLKNVNLNTWIMFTNLSFWHTDRVKMFNNCIENLNKLNIKNNENDIKYIRIARTIYTSKKNINIDKIEIIDKLLEEGKIFQHETFEYGWGKIEEYIVRLKNLKNYVNYLNSFDYLSSNNCDLYFLKYLNMNNFKSIRLNMDKIPINFWMYFTHDNSSNIYFRRHYQTQEYESIFNKLKLDDIINNKLIYKKNDRVSTKYGPGTILEIDENENKFKINVDWENKKEILYLGFNDLILYDKDIKRKSIYLFISNIIQNLEIYTTHFDFSTMSINYDSFIETIKIYLEKVLESKYKNDNMIDKLQLLLEDKDKDIDPDIYNNNISKNIIEWILNNTHIQKLQTIHII